MTISDDNEANTTLAERRLNEADRANRKGINSPLMTHLAVALIASDTPAVSLRKGFQTVDPRQLDLPRLWPGFSSFGSVWKPMAEITVG